MLQRLKDKLIGTAKVGGLFVMFFVAAGAFWYDRSKWSLATFIVVFLVAVMFLKC